MQSRSFSILAGVLAIAGAIALILFLMNPGSSVLFIAAGGLGALGAILGFIDKRSGANTWNRVGAFLGLGVAAACLLLTVYLGGYTVEHKEISDAGVVNMSG